MRRGAVAALAALCVVAACESSGGLGPCDVSSVRMDVALPPIDLLVRPAGP